MAPPVLVLTPPNPRPPAAGLPCYLNWGMTLSVMSRMVFITTSRGTDAVQLTSNMISSQLKFSRRKWMRSTTSSGVPHRLASAVVSGLADPASGLPCTFDFHASWCPHGDMGVLSQILLRRSCRDSCPCL